MSWDLIEHFKLEAQIQGDHTLHTEYVSDPKRGLRKIRVEKRWVKQRNIGQGAFGDVWLEMLAQEDQEHVIDERAVKSIQKHRMLGLNIDYRRELLALAKLSRYQELFVTLHGWFEDTDNVFLAMEYLQHGDLGNYIQGGVAEDGARLICTQLLDGLGTMHRIGFTNRDLKPQNIFVVSAGPQWWVKIGDFGISKRISLEQTALRTQAGTRQFQAPEILGYIEEAEESSEYTNVVDIWSLGCVTHLILTNTPPFANQRALIQYCSGSGQFPSKALGDKGVSMEGGQFVDELLNPHPSQRPAADRASRHTWLQLSSPTTLKRSGFLGDEQQVQKPEPSIVPGYDPGPQRKSKFDFGHSTTSYVKPTAEQILVPKGKGSQSPSRPSVPDRQDPSLGPVLGKNERMQGAIPSYGATADSWFPKKNHSVKPDLDSKEELLEDDGDYDTAIASGAEHRNRKSPNRDSTFNTAVFGARQTGVEPWGEELQTESTATLPGHQSYETVGLEDRAGGGVHPVGNNYKSMNFPARERTPIADYLHPRKASPQSKAASPNHNGISSESKMSDSQAVFGVSLDVLYRRDGSFVPWLVTQFPSSSDHSTALANQFQNDSRAIDFRFPDAFFHDIHAVATLLARFLRELPVPLLATTVNIELEKAVTASTLTPDSVHGAVNMLPHPNYATLRVLALHWNRIAQNSKVNMVTHRDLVDIFGHVLLGMSYHERRAALIVKTILDNTTTSLI